MPRSGSGQFTLDPRYLVAEGETIIPAQHNPVLEDIASDLNTPRPIVAGGTGATSASGARTALSVYSKTETDSGFTKKVSSRTALKALDTATNKACVLTEDTRQKLFMWTEGDFSGAVEDDPDELQYIPADGVDSSLGCWVAVTGGPGDMAKVTYDPDGLSVNAFDKANHIGFTASDVASKNIPASVDSFTTSGYSTPGVGAAKYREAASDLEYENTPEVLRLTDAAGRKFVIAETTLDPGMAGVVGDDSADDTTALTALAEAGRAVRFDGFNCRITSQITAFASNTRFFCEKKHSGGVRLDTDTSSQGVFSVTGKDNVHFDSLLIDGGYSASHTDGRAITFDGCTRSSANKNRFKNTPEEAVLIRDSSDDCEAVGNWCEPNNGGTAQIYLLTSVTNCRVKDNYFEGSAGGCIWLSGGVLNTTITGNRCDGSEFELIGVRWDCIGGVIADNLAQNCGDNGISVTGSGFSVYGNTCRYNDFAGIGIYGNSNNVGPNICYDNGKAGNSQHPGILLAALFGGLAQDNVVVGNEIFVKDGASDEQYYGIRQSNVGYSEWATSTAVTTGAYRYYGNNLYEATTSGTTGITPPTHTSGTASDGAVTWRYVGTTKYEFRPNNNVVGPNRIGHHEGGDVITFGASNNAFREAAKTVEQIKVSTAWNAGQSVYLGYMRTSTASNGLTAVYRAVSAGTTGATAPSHTTGTASDGTVSWRFIGYTDTYDQFIPTADYHRSRAPVQIEVADSPGNYVTIYSGTVNPEGTVIAANASIYLRNNSTFGIQAYVKTGTTNTASGWMPLQYRMSGSTANRPSGQIGMIYYDTTLGKFIGHNGTAWVNMDGTAL